MRHRLKEYVPLASFTTLGVGGSARFFARAETVEEVRQALAFARPRSLPVFVLGGGSNIVIADGGWDGLVLAPNIPDVVFEERGDTILVTAGAGVVWDELVAETARRGLIGLECLSGIPGTVGGAVVANLGAYGAQCSDTFVSADVLDMQDESGAVRVIRKEACDFSYHDSRFSREPGRHLILRATFSLATTGTSRLSYRDNRFDLRALAAERAREPTPADVRAAILEMRGEKGMLSASYRSAGSFFHTARVSADKYAQVAALARSLDDEKEKRLRPWAWQQPDGSYKIAGGFLLEYTEFRKGYARGAVGISPKHTLAIINLGGARASDIAELARDMQSAVEKIFGIRLEREVEYIGDVERGA
jgi:UDP-N-acetylmuramate dehydrogenase